VRILLVTNGLRYGGAERIVEALALDLAAQGDQVAVAATTRGGPIKESLERAGIPVEVLGIASPLDARIPFRLAALARRFGAQVIHSHLAVSDLATALASPLIGRARLVSTVHNTGVELGRAKRSAWIAALHRFDRILAVSIAVRDRLVTASRRLHPEVAHPSLIDAGASPLSRAEARARLGVGPDEALVVGIGRLMPVKGFDVLAAAAERLARGVRVVVIGDGPESARLGGRLELAGGREDAALLLPAADVVACPSRSEGFPQVPLQAMAAARPVVASAIPGLSDIVVPGETGLLVPPEDAPALAAALSELLADPARRASLGAKGRERLLQAGLTRSAMVARARACYCAGP
jgi:glycosyltransferase involved in cell wall biosynthesis